LPREGFFFLLDQKEAKTERSEFMNTKKQKIGE